MENKVFFELHKNLLRESPGLNKYTKKAFEMIPSIKNPNILDIGCGPGTPTILLAKFSNGNVIGLDIHQPYLDELEKKAKKENLSQNIRTVNRSMLEMDFQEEYFDIIWSEGSIYVIGFEKGLKEWKKFLKPKGFLAVHEMVWIKSDPPEEIWDYWKKIYPGISTTPENLNVIEKCEYDIIGYFDLPQDAWWAGYYHPLEKRINMLKKKYVNNPDALKVLNKEQEEVDLYHKYFNWYGSAFYVMQKL